MNKSGNTPGSMEQNPPVKRQPVHDGRDAPTSKRLATEQGKTEPSTFEEEVDLMEQDTLANDGILAEDEEEAEAARLDALLDGTEEAVEFTVRTKGEWERPAPGPINRDSNPVRFQQLDIDYVIAHPHPTLSSRNNGTNSTVETGQTAVVRVFGVTEEGNSICVHVHGFKPYFFVAAPEGFGPDDCSTLQNTLNARMEETQRGDKSKPGIYVINVEIVHRKSLVNYSPVKGRPFLKITMALPTMVTACRGIFERGIPLPNQGTKAFTTYESNVLFVLRFMIDCNVVGGNWLELPPKSYRPTRVQTTRCQLEFDIHYEDLVSYPAEGEFGKLAKLRVLSVDIECAGRKGHFPEAKFDPVIQIASMVTVQGDSKPIIRNVMTLKSCAPIVGADVMSFDDEKDLLRAWRDLVLESDPDLIIGYNIVNFDLPYLLDRADALGIADFGYWGRVRNSRVKMKNTVFSSKAYGTRESKEITIEGRVQFDLLQAIQRDHKLSSYSLNAVSAHFLGEQKEDVHHSIITDLQNGNDETRRRLAVYCLKDAYLPQRLLDKLMYMYNYIEMARVTGVPLAFLLSRGQSIKVFSQLLRKARERNLVIPNLPVQGSPADGVAYEGATVLDAKQGFYQKPIATLDFASLYPSIMMAHNLCYCTLVHPSMVPQMNPKDVVKTPCGDVFVRPELEKGILPEILQQLLSARKRAKADLKKATDPFDRAVLDGRQLALKISANSVYGFTGATVGKLPCLEISAGVTAFGREMIMHTKNLVTQTYNTSKGYKYDADVVYGDTDSVMVNFGVDTVEEAMELGQHAAELISRTFPPPIKLEFEKVYFPYLLINKKRYAGLYWSKPEKFDKMDTKGIETVRRDNCLLVRNVITTCLQKILIDRDVDAAVEYVKQTISDLLMNRLDLSYLVITKALSQDVEAYGTRAPHVELAKKMKKRDPSTAPTVGDRVPYVIVKSTKSARAYEKSEDPIYALEHNIPIDAQHYLEHHLSQPLLRIFEPIMKNPKSLLYGEHTRAVYNPVPSAATGGIMRFAKVRLSCLGCRGPLPDGEKKLCKNCKGMEAELYEKSLGTINSLEEQFARLWSQCQRCQGSLHQDVLCTSRDCPIFYRRKKVQKDLSEAQAQLGRFDGW